jgi:hypothetical protein
MFLYIRRRSVGLEIAACMGDISLNISAPVLDVLTLATPIVGADNNTTSRG